MLDREIFKKTEGRLYSYFRSLKEISDLEIENQEIEAQEESIEWDIKNCNVSIVPDEHMSPNFDERVQTSSTGESLAEKSIIKEIENLENELEYVRRKLRRNRARIRELNRNTGYLRKVLTVPPLSQESMNFIIYKYKVSEDGRCKSVNWIANEMYGGVRSTAYRKREEIIENVAQWTNIHSES